MSKKEQALNAARAVLNGRGVTFEEKGDAIHICTTHGKVVFYASKQKWICRGRSYTGSAVDLCEWAPTTA